jgi:hypothetical protein
LVLSWSLLEAMARDIAPVRDRVNATLVECLDVQAIMNAVMRALQEANSTASLRAQA